jgi:peptidoglycan hydrolase-like protein with peptidoglycan-binding domain
VLPKIFINHGEAPAQLEKLKMTKIRIAKFAGMAAGAALAFGTFAPLAGAQSIAELQAQINALMAQLASLQGSTAVTTTANFTMDLTVGSTGSQVVALQQMLVAQGHLVMPAGVAMGYFGSLTKAAVAKWQAANGVAPAVGYFGPISRAKANSMGTVPGTTVGGTVGGSISTPGVEGVLSATVAPVPSSGQTIHEGDTKEPVLGVEIEADLSDIKIERLKLKLDDTTNSNDRDFYRDIAGTMYVMEGSTVLATVNLNSDTVIEESTGNYYVTITGLNYIVRKDTEKTLTVAIDVEDSIDSTLTNGDIWTVTIPVDGIRGVDGAGVNQYAPSSAIARTFTVAADEAETATLTVSTNVNTPQAKDVVCAGGSDEDECDEMEVLRIDLKADDDDVTLTDLVVDVTTSGSATTTTGYLYSGSTLLASDSIDTDGHAGFTFDDVDFTIDDNSTKTLTVKVDVRDAATSATTILADVDTADVTSENSEGDSITESGSATGETQTVRKVGLELTLVSKSITKGATSSQNNYSTSTVEAQFVIRAKAVGGDIILGTAGSTTVPFASNAGGSHDDNATFDVWVGGSQTALSVASSTSVTVPSGVTNETSNSFTLQEGNTVEIPVSFTFEGRTVAGALVSLGSYAVGIQQLNWVSSAGIQESNFMDNESAWRTSTVSLP